MDTALDIALALAIPISTVLGTMFGGWYSNRTAAKQTEVNALRGRVDELFTKNTTLQRENTMLWEYVGKLQIILTRHGIPVPPLGSMDDASTN